MSNCNLKIPQNPLTLQGMLSPYFLSSTNGDECDQVSFMLKLTLLVSSFHEYAFTVDE